MAGQVPQWLTGAIVDSLRAVGADAPESALEDEAEFLVHAWNVPERTAHNVKYLSSVIERLADFDGVTADPDVLKLAAVYLVTSTVNTWEALGGWESARPVEPIHAEERLRALGVPGPTADRIASLVRQLSSRKLPVDDLEAQILFDALLATIGTTPQRYARFRDQLAREAHGEKDPRYLRARKRFITKILGRSRLFLTPFAAPWTEPVRENLLGELSQINALLGEEDGAGDVVRGEDTGPLLIRGAADRLRAARKGAAEQSARETVPVVRQPAAEKAAARTADPSEDQNPDDTSTLEAFDDPFSHRRSKRH